MPSPDAAIFEENVRKILYNRTRQKNGLLDIKISEQNLDFDAVTITNVPSLWGPAIVEIRVWE